MWRGRTVQQLRSVEGITRTATYRALNRVGQATLRRTLQLLSKDVGLAQRLISPYVKLIRSSYEQLSSIVRVIPHTFNIATFPGTRQVGRGKTLKLGLKGARVSTRIAVGGVVSSAWGSRKLYPGAFLIHGGRTAMHRVGKARYPIKPVYGPRVQREFTSTETQLELKAEVAARLPGEMKHELEYALKQGLR